MNYSVNPTELSSVFLIPSSVSDKHIKLASEYQLKSLLIFLNYQNDNNVYDIISKKLGLEEKEIKECLDYWVQRGVIFNNEQDVIKKVDEKPVNTSVDVSMKKPTREEAVRRIASCEELQYLTTVAQEKLSRTITAAELQTFVNLYDRYGLPVQVIICAIQYAVDSEKKGFTYIERVCIDWAKNDINTLAKAEEKLNSLYLSKTAWRLVESAFGISHRKASVNEEKYANKWVNTYEFNKDMLIAAYNLCIDATSKINFKYINTILENWYENGYKKVSDIKPDDDKKSSKKSNEDKKTSYDVKKVKTRVNDFD